MKIYKSSYGKIEEQVIAHQDARYIYPETTSSTGTLYGVEKKKMKKQNFFFNIDKALECSRKYLREEIQRLQKQLNKL